MRGVDKEEQITKIEKFRDGGETDVKNRYLKY